MISFVVAMDKSRTIGRDNQLPWHLPADLAFFKKLTTGHTIVMGRKTFESIGRPLPNRRNVIITRDKEYTAAGCEVIHSVSALAKLTDTTQAEELFVIGGAEIFKETWNMVSRLYVTWINHEFEGDTFFPEINPKEWKLVSEEIGIKDEKNPYDYYFQIYERTEEILE